MSPPKKKPQPDRGRRRLGLTKYMHTGHASTGKLYASYPLLVDRPPNG